MKLSDIELDLSAVDEGIWVHDIPDLPGVSFCVRGSEYIPYKKAMARFHTASAVTSTRRNRVAQLRSTADLDAEKFGEFMAEQVAKHLLIDWEGIEDDEGAAILPTPDMVLRALTDRSLAVLKRGIMFAVEVVDTGLAAHREEAAGN